jgi:hypothetical protein
LIAIDQRRSTASFWTASGEHIRARSVPPVASGPLFSDRVYTFQQPRLFGLLENERFAFLGPERVVLEGEAGRRPIQSSILAADAAGNVHDLIDLPGGWAYEPERPGSFPIAGFAPMSAPLAVAVHGDGFVWAQADRFEIVQFDHDGQVMRVFGVRQPLNRVTDSLRQSYLESSSYRTWFPVEETLPFPSTLPAFDRTFVSSSGAIWARRFSWGGAPEEWIYFTVAPVAVFRVCFPSRVRIMTATADAAYGVWRDELDVEHLVRFQVQPEPPPL